MKELLLTKELQKKRRIKTIKFYRDLADDEDKVGRIEHKRVSAMFGSGYFQKLFEKYAKVAKNFNIPIKFG